MQRHGSLDTSQMAPHMSYSPSSQHPMTTMKRYEVEHNDWEASATEGLSQLASKLTNMDHHNGIPNHQMHPMAHHMQSYPMPLQHPNMQNYHPGYQSYHSMNAMMTPTPPASHPPHSPHSPPTSNSVSSSISEALDSSTAPQKVRTERYIKVIVRSCQQVANKQLFLSWFLDNNGLPDSCLLLIPERHPNAIINFKGINGWIEIDTKNVGSPEYAIEFELKLQHSFLNRKNNLQNQPIGLRFFLLDKQIDGSITCLGEVMLNVILMSAKCSTKALVTRLTKSHEAFHPKPY